jgi:hypothetical protein
VEDGDSEGRADGGEPAGVSVARLMAHFDSVLISFIDLGDGTGPGYVISGVTRDGSRVRASGVTPALAALAALGEDLARGCLSCGRVLPPGSFHRQASQPSGLSPRCKGCERERVRNCKKRRAAAGEPLRAPWPEAGVPRPCFWCRRHLPDTAFNVDRSRPGGRRRTCRECEKARWPWKPKRK